MFEVDTLPFGERGILCEKVSESKFIVKHSKTGATADVDDLKNGNVRIRFNRSNMNRTVSKHDLVSTVASLINISREFGA